MINLKQSRHTLGLFVTSIAFIKENSFKVESKRPNNNSDSYQLFVGHALLYNNVIKYTIYSNLEY